jgi:hypothetical protein
MNDIRKDRNLDSAVNKGLATALLVNTSAGVRLMTTEGVPPEVIARVLHAPHQCRATDWKPAQVTT